MSLPRSSRRALTLFGLLILLIVAMALSMLVGAKTVPASVIVDALTGTCQSADCTIIRDARLPRTLAGLLAGGALGLAGALMQTLTRNPAGRQCRGQFRHCPGCGLVWRRLPR